MGPFPGRFLNVSVGVMPDTRPTTPKTISLDTRLMSRWMTAFMQSGGIITDVRTGSTRENSSKDKPEAQAPTHSEKIVAKTKSTSTNKIKAEEAAKAEECSIEEKKPARKRSRRKAR